MPSYNCHILFGWYINLILYKNCNTFASSYTGLSVVSAKWVGSGHFLVGEGMYILQYFQQHCMYSRGQDSIPAPPPPHPVGYLQQDGVESRKENSPTVDYHISLHIYLI
jgi:hypothetical protein